MSQIPTGGDVHSNEEINIQSNEIHYNPDGSGVKIFPDIAIKPNKSHVPDPTVPIQVLLQGYSHARIVVEIANLQFTDSLTTKYRLWLQETYVRYVLGIKLHTPKDTMDSQEKWLRAMIARL
ncbi:hypothetical protein F8M41_022544 [Gigaspora margarita]|uniref:Uncharacterized protein n=1 Tax=Gigaspora margarita TaxID=4874 RepID=A0A8H4B548_GIGMA|nr:hypothetical protein F8M41_022544 [Gigaspora margarita]